MADSVGLQSTKMSRFCDVERELAATRRVLERVPEEQFQWKPNEKSMTLQAAGGARGDDAYLVRVDARAGRAQLYVAAAYSHATFSGSEAVLKTFDEHAAKFRKRLRASRMGACSKTWTLRNGEQVVHTQVGGFVLCFALWCVSHMIHHRGQLCLYLRMLRRAGAGGLL